MKLAFSLAVTVSEGPAFLWLCFPLFTVACCLLINPALFAEVLCPPDMTFNLSLNIIPSSSTPNLCHCSQLCVSLSSLQSEVRVTVHVDPKDGRQHLFRVILRFTNPSKTSVTGSIRATNNRGTAGKAASDIESALTFHIITSNLTHH